MRNKGDEKIYERGNTADMTEKSGLKLRKKKN